MVTSCLGVSRRAGGIAPPSQLLGQIRCKGASWGSPAEQEGIVKQLPEDVTAIRRAVTILIGVGVLSVVTAGAGVARRVAGCNSGEEGEVTPSH